MKKNHHHIKLLIIVCATFLSALTLWSTILYTLDPLSLFHQKLTPPLLPSIGQARYRLPGQIINYGKNFEGIIVGNSVSTNFSPELIKKELNFYPLMAAADGASIYEQQLIAKLALKHNPHFTHVFWGLYDMMTTFQHINDQGVFKHTSIPLELYDESRINDFKYYLSFSIVPYIEKQFRQPFTNTNNQDFNWSNKRQPIFSKPPAEKGFTKDVYINKKDDPAVIENIDLNIQHNLLPLFAKYPQVKFILVLPPTSFAIYKTNIAGYKHLITRMYEIDENIPNVKVYNFTAMQAITTNVDNYCDPVHFSEKISDLIVTDIAEGKYRLNEQLLKQSLAAFDLYEKITPTEKTDK